MCYDLAFGATRAAGLQGELVRVVAQRERAGGHGSLCAFCLGSLCAFCLCAVHRGGHRSVFWCAAVRAVREGSTRDKRSAGREHERLIR